MKMKVKRVIGGLLIFAMMAGTIGMAGCGQTETGSGGTVGGTAGENKGEDEEREENPMQEETAEGEKAMGRYLEKADDSLKEELGTGSKIIETSDGSLTIMSPQSGKWVSTDNGMTWEREKLAWFEELKAGGVWIMEIAVAKDGSVAVIYAEDSETEEGESGAEEEDESKAEEESVPEEEGESKAEAESGTESERGISFLPKYGLVSPDGLFTELDIPFRDREYIQFITFAEDGRLFGASLGGKVFEIDKGTGAVKEVVELPGTSHYMIEKDNRLLLVHVKGVTIVDLDSGEVMEDKILDEFLHDQFGNFIEYNTEGVHPLLIMPDSDGVIFLAFEKGIYRHVIGGNVMEQIVDGSLTSLYNPYYGLSDGILVNHDEFLLLFSVGELMRYTYEPNIPATPEVQMTVYSLRESRQLRAVISKYQSEHPEAYIRYEIGLGDNSAVTREDALKKLNTEIAAGKGPDMFLLDDMPMDSYKEKGVLLDLTPYLADKEEDKYFSNVLKAFQEPEGVYAVPSQFQIALVIGEKTDIEKMIDLESMARVVEQYREEKPEGSILGARNEDEVLNLLLPVCAPAWKDAEGKVDKNALEEFYTLAKRIWDAEDAGLDTDTREEYKQFLADMRVSGIGADEMREIQLSVGGKVLGYMNGEKSLIVGLLQYSSGFDMITSCFKTERGTDKGFAAYNGQAKGVFMPKNLMGISKTCGQQEAAVELMGMMLDDDGWENIPVNKEKLKEKFRANDKEDGGSYASIGGSNADGSGSYSMDLYASSEEDVERLMEVVEESPVPYVQDSILEKAVCEAGGKVLRGEISPLSGAEEVVQKTAIYMSE